ncbi:hypothetical protein C8R43DRAFT_1024978 [Mycena crocata]|nr:hypothetical protein C8R43DRAFT_1024978 [Mycena crocata]
MVAGGRNPFTQDDDNLLVKYLAKYNPGVQGRSGNKIYKVLVENENGKWRWSSRHPWGGWRDRYVKDQRQFDKRIKKYQLEKGLPTENAGHINGTQKHKASDDEEDTKVPKRKRKGSPAEDTRKRARMVEREEAEESDEEQGARKSSAVAVEESGGENDSANNDQEMAPHVPNIYPDLTGLARSSSHKLSALKLKTKPLPPRDTDSDFFASVPPTPTTATTDAPTRPPTTTSGRSVTSNTSDSDPLPARSKGRRLPKLVEGAFSTAFAGVRRWAGGAPKSDDEATQWPPSRVRKSAPKSTHTENNARNGDDMEVEHEEKAVPTAPPMRRPPQQVNAVASSSRVQLPPASPRREISEAPRASITSLPDSQVQRRHQTPVQTPPRQTPLSPSSPLDWGSEPRPSQQRSQSPIDWGSPRMAEDVDSSPGNTWMTPLSRTPVTSTKAGPPPVVAARSARRSLSRHDVGSTPYHTPNDMGSSPHNRNRDSIDSVDQGRPARRSRAPSPRTDARPTRYRLPSPPRTGSSRPRAPSVPKAKRRQDPLPPGFRPTPKHIDDDARRRSLPAVLPRLDLDKMRPSAPRQSLPPRPPPQRDPLPRRHGSLFAPRVVSLASTSVSPVRPPGAALSISATDRAFIEQLGLQQAIAAMAANHSFDMEVVRNAYQMTGDLAKTDEILLQMRRAAEAAGQAALRELGGDTAPAEKPFVFRHRRQHSAATASSAKRSPQSAPSSSQRKKRRVSDEFHPQPLARDVLAEVEYTPPSGSRAGAIARLAKKGRMEEGLLREKRRASGGGTVSGFSREVMQGQGQRLRLDMEDDVPPTPQFEAFAEGDEGVLRELERRDVSLGLMRAADVAQYMLDGSIPSPYR